MTIPLQKTFFFFLFSFPIILFSQDENPKKEAPSNYTLAWEKIDDSTDPNTKKIQQAVNFMQEGKYRKAIRMARKNLKKHPQETNLYFIQVMGYSHLGKPQRVEKVFKNAFEELPASALLYYNYGIKKRMDGNYAEADQFIQQSLQLKPSFPESHLALSKIHELQGNRIKAILPLYAYFLFKNDNSELPVEKLEQLLYRGVEVVQESGLSFSLPYSKENKDSEMLKMEVMLNELNLFFNEQDVYQQDKMLAFTESIFNQLNEKQQFQEDIWWSFYAKILGSIAEKEFIKAFVFNELKKNSVEAREYLLKHDEEVERYQDWKRGL